MAQLNRGSFLVFFDSNGPEKLPRPFDIENGYVNPEVILVHGESYQLYVAANIGTLTAITSNSDHGITSSVTTISTLAGTHNLLSFSLASNLPEGCYVMKAGSNVSQPVAVMSAVNAAKFSAYVTFKHPRSLGNFYYPYSPEFENKIRIRLNARETQPFIEKETYSRSIDGQYRGLQGKRSRFTIFETTEYADEMHAACEIMTLHDTITINGISYTYRGESSYQLQGDNGHPVSNGEFGLTRNDSTILIRA